MILLLSIPQGGVLAGHLFMASGLSRVGEVAKRIIAGEYKRGVAHATSGPLLATKYDYGFGGYVMAELAAVVGIGQTKYQTKRSDVSIAGLVREAAMNALNDAGLAWDDIDAVILGKAPDMFEGVVMPELYLTDALGCNGKPMIRVHTAGSVGGSTAIVAASHVQSGVFKRVLTVTFEKQSESNAMWALSNPQPFSPHLNAGAGGYFAPIIREYIRRSNAPSDAGIKVAVKDRIHALKNPLAHLQLPDISAEMVEASPMLWDPLRFLESLSFLMVLVRWSLRMKIWSINRQVSRLDSGRRYAL